MDDALRARFESALAFFPPGPALVALVKSLVEEGRSQRDIFDRFDEMRDALQKEGRDFDEDAIMQVMDRISGWRDADRRLFPQTLSR